MPTGSDASVDSESSGDILAVDDSPANLMAIEAALGDLGSRVVRAHSGAEALRLVLNRDFALILLDVNMPSMGGFETARIIRSRKRSSHTPIIFITAYDRDDRDVQAAYQLGAVDFLFKPIVANVLMAKASVFVELRERTAEVARQAEQIREHERREYERTLEEERHRWHELTMRREMEQLAEADQRKDHFLAMLAHELRTPLTPIVTGLALIREKLAGHTNIDDVVFRTRDAMERQAEHLKRLVDDLLDISRISSGKIELRSSTLDVRTIVTHAVAACKPLLDERQHQLSVELGDAPLNMRGDEVRMIQIVANLLTNAARYTNQGGQIQIVAKRQADQIEVRVIDNGNGIAPEFLPRIFDVFVQGAPSTSAGLGLGLSLVARLVQLHGGTVAASSEGVGKGSELLLRFPADTSVVVSADAKKTSVRPPAAIGGARPLRVVIVEDNEDIREMLRELLTLWHHDVSVAEDGVRGAALVLEVQPDVALIDVGLPELDGYGVAARVREQLGSEQVRLVAMTGFGQDADRRKAKEAGFDVHLVKPVSMDDLKRVLSFQERDANRSDNPQAEERSRQG